MDIPSGVKRGCPGICLRPPKNRHQESKANHQQIPLHPMKQLRLKLIKPLYIGWWYTYPSEKYESQLG